MSVRLSASNKTVRVSFTFPALDAVCADEFQPAYPHMAPLLRCQKLLGHSGRHCWEYDGRHGDEPRKVWWS